MDDGFNQKTEVKAAGKGFTKSKRFSLPWVCTRLKEGCFTLLLCALLVFSGCKEERTTEWSASFLQESSYEATLSIDLTRQYPVNPFVLGSNVQWVDRGDGVLASETKKLDPAVVTRAKNLGVSILRYPGGSLSDLYHWQDGFGPLDKRGKNRRFHGSGDDQILFGTREFLAFCREIGAEPMVTVNLITGTPSEAADWVKKVNITGLVDQQGPLPKVQFWEIGNEPYLIDDNQRDLSIQPDAFAKRATEFIRAMKKMDPSIKVGIPLRSDKLAGVPATPLPGYNKTVLQGVDEPFDFVSVHSAYYPFVYDHIPTNQDIYLAAMAATQVVKQNFDQTQQELNRFLKKPDIPIALTEYNAMFTLGRGQTDGYIASFTGALYVADLLTMLAKHKNLLMANYWSLIGNWYFGAIAQDGSKRPTYHVLEGFRRVWHGARVEMTLAAPALSSPAVGFLPAQTKIPAISALATVDQEHLSILFINKHPTAVADLTLNLSGKMQMNSAKIERLAASDLFAYDSPKANLSWTPVEPLDLQGPIRLSLPPSSVSIVEFQ